MLSTKISGGEKCKGTGGTEHSGQVANQFDGCDNDERSADQLKCVRRVAVT